jgi:hypothetical protein
MSGSPSPGESMSPPATEAHPDGPAEITRRRFHLLLAAAGMQVSQPASAARASEKGLALSAIAERQINLNKLLLIAQWSPSLSRYTRAQGLVRLEGRAAKIKVIGYAGDARRLESTGYSLLLDGQVVKRLETPPNKLTEITFELDATQLVPGWVEVDVRPDAGNETCPPYFALVVRNGSAGTPSYTPVARGSYTMAMNGDGRYHYGRVPPTYAPTPVPRKPRKVQPFADFPGSANLHIEMVVPRKFGDTHRIGRTREGALCSFALQPYHYYDMVAQRPKVPLLDGPRNVGTVVYATHVEIGSAAPPGIGFVGNIYFCDPWRVGKIRADGEIVTLAGWRHRGIVDHWQDPQNLELVGDWSAVPAERRGFHELWGIAWDERTFAFDASAAPIPGEGNLQPHLTGVVMFVADTQRDRVCRLEFSPTSHAVPPKVTEFLTGLADPWDVVCRDGVLYVAERLSHRIAAYDARTGALLRVVVQGPGGASVDVNREVVRRQPVAALQTLPCVAPEGLYLLDDWLYWGSIAQAQVRRVSLKTGEVQVVAAVATDGNTKFCKIAVSDGTFGERGTVFWASWTNAQYGYPAARRPDGTGWSYYYGNEPFAGAGGGFVYPSAVGVSHGRLVFGGAGEGIMQITRRQPGDATRSEQAAAGSREFAAKGYDLAYGAYGYGQTGQPLPWGESSNIDAYLVFCGHTRP